ncbi:MAG: class I SAM-dependent DNA methyltransferase [Alphaproteobacteria bacterium]
MAKGDPVHGVQTERPRKNAKLKGYGPSTFGELNAENYDIYYPTDAGTLESVDVLADLAAGGKVLELAIGTGRVALPLAARGLSLSGIDASRDMIAKLKEKPGGESIAVAVGDIADVAVDGEYDLIFLVFNTLFNLTSQDDQVRCFANVARHLTRRGVFVLEAFVPDVAHFVDRDRVRTVEVTFGRAVLEASVHDPVTQTINYQYIMATRDGMRLIPLPLRYAWPSEIDLMARLAGLELRQRWGGWDRSAFVATSAKHVSVYGWARAETS